MTLAQLIPLAFTVSIGLIVLGLGLQSQLDELTYLLRRPGLLLRSILAMHVVMPLLAVAMASLFDLTPPVRIALVALALSPVPPILPKKQTAAGGRSPYVFGLLVAAATMAIVVVPAGIAILARAFDREISVPPERVLAPVLTSVIAPLVLGAILHRLAPELARRVAAPLSTVGTVLLLVTLVPVLIVQWRNIVEVVGNGTLVALALFTLLGVAAGHLLGGPDPGDRTALALATGTRHPGVALAIATAAFPQQTAVLAVVLWHLVVGGLVAGPYVKWRTRVHAAPAPAAGG